MGIYLRYPLADPGSVQSHLITTTWQYFLRLPAICKQNINHKANHDPQADVVAAPFRPLEYDAAGDDAFLHRSREIGEDWNVAELATV